VQFARAVLFSFLVPSTRFDLDTHPTSWHAFPARHSEFSITPFPNSEDQQCSLYCVAVPSDVRSPSHLSSYPLFDFLLAGREKSAKKHTTTTSGSGGHSTTAIAFHNISSTLPLLFLTTLCHCFPRRQGAQVSTHHRTPPDPMEVPFAFP